MRRDPRVVVLGEDVGTLRRRLPRHPGLAGGVRAGSLHRHAAGRVGDHRHGDRHGAVRHAPGPRDPVRRLHLSGVRSDRQRAGQVSLPLGGRIPGAGRHPHAGRRRHQGRPLPLAVARGDVHARAGPEGGLPVEPRRRQGAADERDPRRRSRHLHGAEALLPAAEGRGSGGRIPGAARRGEGGAARQSGDGDRVERDGRDARWRRRRRARRAASISRSSTCARWCRSTWSAS